MEISEGLAQQQRLQAIADKRKRLVDIENKKRQLEDDRRQLQHLKSKALRERWLLDGAPSGGPEHDEAKKKLEEDEAKTKELEETIARMEQELEELETGVKASSTSDSLVGGAVEDRAQTAGSKSPSGSVKVVHEVNGENGVHLLSSTEVDELIHKADEISMISEPAPSPASPAPPASPTPPANPTPPQAASPAPPQAASPAQAEPEAAPAIQITGMEAKSVSVSPTAGGAASVAEASPKHPVTMTFMGYQSVEDEAETRKVLGLEGTVKAELVVIEDGGDAGKVSPASNASAASLAKEQTAPPNGNTAAAATDTAAPAATASVKVIEPAAPASGETGEPEGGAKELSKEKQPCKCCSIM